MSFDDSFRKGRPSKMLRLTTSNLAFGLSRRFWELAVFDARLYIRVGRGDQPA
jgi:hypothetical protein